MKTLRSYEDVPGDLRGGVIAIGNFDGVHRGHQAVIAKTLGLAQQNHAGAPVGVMCFSPHPRRFFAPDAPLFQLTTEAQKVDLFAAQDLDFTAIIPFDAALAGLDAEAFVADVLVAGLGVAHVVIGYDFHFGKKRGGSPQTMQALGETHGFGVTIVAPESDGGEIYSSSRVRAHLRAGDVAEAARLLGRPWSVRGEVAHGDGRGTGLGFPTANIAMPDGADLLPGIYAVRVKRRDALVDGAAYLGTRPTFDGIDVRLETFLFDFDGSLYGDEIEVMFVAFVRGDEAFADGEALARQMDIDVANARDALAADASRDAA
ncbi:MAG: bifunctional riboflavin kinase/FAD synthetase [Pseudomonadota bacterium]